MLATVYSLAALLHDHLTLARRLAEALGRVAADALSPSNALPSSPDELADPAALGRLLAAGGSPLRPRRVRATDHEAPSSNCRNSVFRVDWEPPETGPPSVFVKQPCADLPTRLFANVIGFWAIECAFCRDLAADAPIPTPRIHAVAEQRSRFVIVMENLLERPGTRLFVNRDLLAGVDLPRAKACLRALARLHAGFAGIAPTERARRLPLDLHPFLSPTSRPVMLAVNRLAVSPCHRRAPGVFDAEAAALYRRALERWDALARVWYREPLTLVHGDSHLGNFFGSGAEMGLLDFQATHWGQGPRDVAYFLQNSMRPELLAEHERDLVAFYCRERETWAAPIDRTTAWEQYRGFSFQVLMTAVVSRGLGSFTDSDAVIDAMLERAVAAVRRLHFERWLDEVC